MRYVQIINIQAIRPPQPVTASRQDSICNNNLSMFHAQQRLIAGKYTNNIQKISPTTRLFA